MKNFKRKKNKSENHKNITCGRTSNRKEGAVLTATLVLVKKLVNNTLTPTENIRLENKTFLLTKDFTKHWI